MNSRKYQVAVVGATGAVGQEMLTTLAERKFPIDTLHAFASKRSAGKTLNIAGQSLKVKELTPQCFSGIDIALFSAGGSISKEWAPQAASAGAIVIDNTSCFRMETDVPLVVPEVNASAIFQYEERRIIANPNCSTIQMVLALNPLHQEAQINRVVVSTYQAVSGAGQKAINQLSEQTRAIFNFQDPVNKALPHQIAFNCLPHIDVFLEDGSTKEEWKMVQETKKILQDDSIQVTATCVRVPVFNGHAEAVNVETEEDITPERAREILGQAPGVTVLDNPKENLYPLQVHASGQDDTFVGRIRRDLTVPHGLNLWIVSDNLRKGAALNAIQIAEFLIREVLK